MSVVAGTPRLRALAAGLRKARETAGMSTRELAQRLKLSQQLVSHWENGRRIPRVEQVGMMVAVLRTEPPERDRLIQLARNVHEPNWLTVGVPGISEQLAGAIESEKAAAKIIEWSPLLIPGLLQTPEYARVIVSNGGRATHDVDARMMVRMGRREVLTRRDPVPFTAIVGEESLRNPLVEPDLMADQLDYLVQQAAKPHITVRVVPSRPGWHPGLVGPFVLYEFPDSGPVMYFEHYSSGAFVPDENDTARYYSAIETMDELAKSPDASVEIMATIAKGWTNNHG